MLGITFSAEAEPSAAERISDCFQYFESRMDVVRLPRYCKVLDSIKIIPVSYTHLRAHET